MPRSQQDISRALESVLARTAYDPERDRHVPQAFSLNDLTTATGTDTSIPEATVLLALLRAGLMTGRVTKRTTREGVTLYKRATDVDRMWAGPMGLSQGVAQ